MATRGVKTLTEKSALRLAARAARTAFVDTLDAMGHRLSFRAVPGPVRALIAPCARVALYMPIGDEAPANRLADALLALDKQLCLPHVIDRMGTMEFRVWTPGDPLVEGRFGISAPDAHAASCAPDAIFAPLLAFDGALNRLGQGGGYYDRAFARYPDAVRIGLGWSVQQIDSVPADPWDLPLHAVMTECAVVEGPASS